MAMESKQGLWAGADMDKESAPMLFDRGAVAPGVNAGYVEASNGSKQFPGTIYQWNPGHAAVYEGQSRWRPLCQ